MIYNGQKKILIIDDESDIANNIKAILEDENYSASIANDSTSALGLINSNEYNLIILDVWLDNSVGWYWYKKIKRT